MVKKEKCGECRHSKQRVIDPDTKNPRLEGTQLTFHQCLPEVRTWDANIQQKCEHCVRGNRPCGPNEMPPDRPPRKRTFRTQQAQSSTAEQALTHEQVERDREGELSPARASARLVSDASKDLMDMLRDLDAVAEAARRVKAATKELEKRDLAINALNIFPEFHKLAELRHVTSQTLLETLREVEDLGDRADAVGDKANAELAYTQVLEIYREQNPIASSICRLRIKMAKFYQKIGRPFRAEKYLRDNFEQRDAVRQNQNSREEAWKGLSTSLSKTSEMISHALRHRYTDLDSRLNLETPFPPLHRMVESDHTCTDFSDYFCSDPSSDVAASSSIHDAITSGAGHVANIIPGIPDTELGTRDILSRTPLFLAAFLKQEAAGHALLERITALGPVHQRLQMNARDVSGQTVLGTSILSGCSPQFVKALIDRGADVNPEKLMRNEISPLQAAHSTSRAEIVDLLIEHGADANLLYQDNSVPAQVDKCVGDQTIMQLNSEESHSAFLTTGSQSTQYQSLADDKNSDDDFGFDFFTSDDATMSSPPDIHAHNSQPDFLYPEPPS